MASAIKIIAGLFILLIGFPIFIGGSAILLIVPIFADNQGYFMTPDYSINQEGVSAIRLDIPLDDINIGVRIDPSKFVTIKMDVQGPSNSEVFVGLTTSSTMDQILTSNVSYVRITNLDFSSDWEFGEETQPIMTWETIKNTSNWAPPQISGVSWLANTGRTDSSFIWAPTYSEITGGSLSVILMQEDLGLSNEIDIAFSIGAKIPIINAIGWVLVVFGGLFSLLGVILIWSGLRTKKHRPERVRYYSGAPAQRVEAVARPAPKYQLQCSNCGSLNETDSSFCSQCGEVLLSEDRKTVDDVAKERPVEIFEPTGSKLVVAEGSQRFWAWLIDIVIVGAVTSTLSSLIFFSFNNWDLWSFGFWDPFQWIFSVGPSSIIFFLYSALMEYYYGQTLGKMVLNIEVVSQRTGERPTIGEIAISAVGKAFFLPLDVLLGWIARDEAQVPNLEQRLTQKWARTVVILQQKRKEETAQFVSSRI